MTQRPSEHLRTLQDVNARKTKIQDITDALISSGYTSLDQQAKALGLNRATVWTIRENKHKLGRLSAKTIERIITNPTTPPRVLSSTPGIRRRKVGGPRTAETGAIGKARCSQRRRSMSAIGTKRT